MRSRQLDRAQVRCPKCKGSRLGHDPNERGLQKSVTCDACGFRFELADGIDRRAIERAKERLVSDVRADLRRALGRSKVFKVKF